MHAGGNVFVPVDMAVWRKALQSQFPRNKWKILRGDQVMIIAGKDAGESGTVTKVIRSPTFPRVIVEGLNLNKRAVKRTQDNPGGMVSVESPVAYSNVSLIDPVTKHPVKVTWRYLEDGTKVRVTRGNLASGSIIARPEILTQRRKLKPASLGSADTPVEVAEEQTYVEGSGDLPSALKVFMEEMRAGGVNGEGDGLGGVRFKKLRRSVIAKPVSGNLASQTLNATPNTNKQASDS